MQTKIIEVTNHPTGMNWGKFLLGRFDADEWNRRAAIEGHEAPGTPLLIERGWRPGHLLVLDLQTGEGAIFSPGGSARHDLNERHEIWVCPMYEPFLNWLYKQDLSDIDKLPDVVEFTEDEAPSAVYGYRRHTPFGSFIEDMKQAFRDQGIDPHKLSLDEVGQFVRTYAEGFIDGVADASS